MPEETAIDRGGMVPASRPADEVCQAVTATCRRLYAVEGDFVTSFRVSLIQLVPELRFTTPDGGAAIAEGLARAVLWAGLTADPPEVVEITFQNVGAEYRRQGFPGSGYHGAGHALLRAARDIQIGDWTSELSSAWVAYYSWLAAHLVHGAGAAAGPEPAPPPRGASRIPPAGGPFDRTPPSAVPPGTGTRSPGRGSTPNHGGYLSVDQMEQRAVSVRAGRTTHQARREPGDVPGEQTPTGLGLSGPTSLDDVLDLLRSRYFAGNERALGAIVTRVALRTGADLRAPRPDQVTNPAVIANVVAVLQVMGYVLQPIGAEEVQLVFSPSPSDGADSARWWNRRRTASARGWRRSMPGTSR